MDDLILLGLQEEAREAGITYNLSNLTIPRDNKCMWLDYTSDLIESALLYSEKGS